MQLATFSFGALILGGLIAAYTTLQSPKEFISSWNWQETTCVITKADFLNSAPSVEYSFEFNGERFSSNRYAVLELSSHFLKTSEARKISELRAAGSATCYVNPEDPSRAVIARFQPVYLLILGLISFLLATSLASLAYPLVVLLLGPPNFEEPEWTAGKDAISGLKEEQDVLQFQALLLKELAVWVTPAKALLIILIFLFGSVCVGGVFIYAVFVEPFSVEGFFGLQLLLIVAFLILAACYMGGSAVLGLRPWPWSKLKLRVSCGGPRGEDG